MTISFHPKAGMVLICDFAGYVMPEIVKTRPVVVISPNHHHRPGLCTVVPLSTTVPHPVEAWHVKLLGNPIPGRSDTEVWAKCDLVASVALSRLDRVKLGRGQYLVGGISGEQLKTIRLAAARSFGVDIEGK